MLSEFHNIAGLKLNRARTEIMQIGIPLTLSETLFRLKWEKEKIYALVLQRLYCKYHAYIH